MLHDKILDWSNLKAFADDKISGTEKFKLVFGRVENIMGKGVFGRVENIMGKGEIASYQHLLLFQQYFQKASSL